MRNTDDFTIEPLREIDIHRLARLAREIWLEHYAPILSIEQIDYMLTQRYDPEVIRDQLGKPGIWWDAMILNGTPIGFAASETGEDPGRMKLDKLYVKTSMQGRGLGHRLLTHVENRARALGLHTLWLQVNRHNTTGIAFYERAGFRTEAEAKFDIGGGFVMDDFLMEKPLTAVAG
ncbi:MAG: GNAT family N-acetyltransferase [Burkholderiales bacterium]|jgi:ribosomal protein S18 acetylase RimI-like enzyme|nr:GNAT family N-acetyltransferase [Burkholderiales bacterium]